MVVNLWWINRCQVKWLLFRIVITWNLIKCIKINSIRNSINLKISSLSTRRVKMLMTLECCRWGIQIKSTPWMNRWPILSSVLNSGKNSCLRCRLWARSSCYQIISIHMMVNRWYFVKMKWVLWMACPIRGSGICKWIWMKIGISKTSIKWRTANNQSISDKSHRIFEWTFKENRGKSSRTSSNR